MNEGKQLTEIVLWIVLNSVLILRLIYVSSQVSIYFKPIYITLSPDTHPTTLIHSHNVTPHGSSGIFHVLILGSLNLREVIEAPTPILPYSRLYILTPKNVCWSLNHQSTYIPPFLLFGCPAVDLCFLSLSHDLERFSASHSVLLMSLSSWYVNIHWIIYGRIPWENRIMSSSWCIDKYAHWA